MPEPSRSGRSIQVPDPPRAGIHELRNALGSTLLSLTAARHALGMDDRQHASVCLDDAQAACEECRRLLVLIDPAQASTGTEVHDEGASVPDPQAGRPIP